MTDAATSHLSSATEIALRLLQASSCFRPGAACGSLPCACAQSLVDALSPHAQIAGGDWSWGVDYGKNLLIDLNQLAHASGTTALLRDGLQRAYKEITRLRKTALSPQAQAGETRETAEAWIWKDGIPAPAQRPTEPVREALEEWVAQGYIDADGDHCGAAAYAPALYVKSVAALKLSSPPAALPAGQVVVTPEMVSAGMAEIPEDGAEYEHVEAAYRKMAALAIPSTNSNTEAKPSRLENLERQVLAHEKLQARIAGALGLETWHGDLADAVRVRLDAGPEDTTTKHSGTFLGYRDEHGNEMHCANAFCPHEDRCRKRCICPVAMSSTTSGGATK